MAARPRPLLLALAALFAVATIAYSAIWIYCVHVQRAYLGVVFEEQADKSLLLTAVRPGTPAEAAGLLPGDRLTHVDGQPLSARPLARALAAARPGDGVPLTVRRPRRSDPLVVRAVVVGAPSEPWQRTRPGRIVSEIISLYPVPFVLVGLAALFMRLEDRHAWLLALLFATLIAGAPLLPWEGLIAPGLRGFALAYKVAFGGLSAGVFLYFFSVFPAASPLDRRAPWLKHLWLGAGLLVSLPLAAWALLAGSSRPLLAFGDALPAGLRAWVLPVYYIGGYLLGLTALAANAAAAAPAVRNKSRVVLWGMLLGFGPSLLLTSVSAAVGRDSLDDWPAWVWAPVVMALLLIPLSFAYAVVIHRVLEVPVLLRKSARYLLVQRGSLLLLVLLALASTSVFASAVAPRLAGRTSTNTPAAAVTLGAAFGIVLLWGGTQVQRRLRERIDRAFFRGAYDARQILQDLAERARSASSRETLAALLEPHLRSALLPSTLAVYLEDGVSRLVLAQTDTAGLPKVLSPALPVLREVAGRGQPRVLGPQSLDDDLAGLQPLAPECLVPLLGRDGRLIGLIALGSRLSDEPYSGEDKRLLASVGSQAALALESIVLAEQMAERLDDERRAAHEMELAQRVQRRLLPQELPPMATLDYAGCCLQARAVGGDYYDFLDLGRGRLGLVLADVSGKGFPAALLMASLQASLRSRSPEDLLDLCSQLRAVNHLLFRSSETSRYATLFVGLYDDATRRLRYANCGHNPPLLLRGGGGVEQLAPTAPVLGLFLEEWDCAACEVTLAPGDTLILYTDGVTEAWSDAGEEFGPERLIEAASAAVSAPTAVALERVLAAVDAWSGVEQEDDLTLVLVRAV